MKKTQNDKRLSLKHTTLRHLNQSMELDRQQLARVNGGLQLASIDASMPECGTWCAIETGPW